MGNASTTTLIRDVDNASTAADINEAETDLFNRFDTDRDGFLRGPYSSSTTEYGKFMDKFAEYKMTDVGDYGSNYNGTQAQMEQNINSYLDCIHRDGKISWGEFQTEARDILNWNED